MFLSITFTNSVLVLFGILAAEDIPVISGQKEAIAERIEVEGKDYENLSLIRQPLIVYIFCHTADAVPAHFCPGTVRIIHLHFKIRDSIFPTQRMDKNNPIAPDAKMPVAKFPYNPFFFSFIYRRFRPVHINIVIYKLILMDVRMPVMDGYEATKTIRKLENRQLASIPILAMTANILPVISGKQDNRYLLTHFLADSAGYFDAVQGLGGR